MRGSLYTRIGVAVALLSIAMALAASAFFYRESNQRLISVARESLDGRLTTQEAELDAAVEEMVRDVRLMASTPPIQGLIRAERNDGMDPLDISTDNQWRQRLSVLFSALLENKPDYLQARYITADHDGLELVRVQRSEAGGPIHVASRDALQAKGGEPYVPATLGLGPNDVFISEVTLNREHGHIQRPFIPVIRAAVPIYDERQRSAFGLVVINLDARPVLAKLGAHDASLVRYATDGTGRYIAHPLSEIAFRQGQEEMPSAEGDFPRLSRVLEGTDDGHAEVDGERIVAMRRVRLGPGPNAPALGLVFVRPISSVIQGNVDTFRGLIPVFVVLTLFGLVLGLALARPAVRPIAQLAKAVRSLDVEHRTVQRPEGLTGEAAALADSLEQAIASLRAADRVEANNRELRQFAYVASHDLQEPVRTIVSFADLLEDEYRDRLDEDGKAALRFVKRAASRMQALLTDLLEHSRLGSMAPPGLCDLDQLLEDVQEDLTAQFQATHAKLEVEALGELVVYPVAVRVLFQNLVSNAIKFYRGDGVPHLTVSAEAIPDGMRFRVCDNGPGIPEDKRDEVFMMFKRLHKRSEVEGTGIGLANCRKVVEMHGGEIRITNSPLGGACFEFELKRVE